jgi:hypothetical protein
MKKNNAIKQPKTAKSKTGQIIGTALYIVTFALVLYFFVEITDWNLF